MSHNVPQDPTTPNETGLQAVPFLTAAKIFADAAESLGLPHETVSRWLTDPAFRQHYEKQWDESAEISTGKVRIRTQMTVFALAKLLDSHLQETTATRLVTIPDPIKALQEREREAHKRFQELLADARKRHHLSE